MRMPRCVVPVLFLAAAASFIAAPAAHGQANLAPTQRAAITDSIRQFTDAAFAAGRSKDLNRLFSFYSPTTSLLIDGKVKDWAQHQAEARAFYGSLRSADLRPLTHEIQVLAPTVALWRGEYSYAFTDSAGHVIKGASASTWVIQRSDRGWQIVHVHISDPLPTVKPVK
jgi:ketosteroid isomerase-like protein